MFNYGCTSIYEFLGDFVVYRSLKPMDSRLPSLRELCSDIGLPEGVTPRKSQPAYGQVMALLLSRARALELPGVSIERLLYVGDTQMNDGAAFGNTCRAGGWPGWAFIGADRDEPAYVEVVEQEGNMLYLANRWSALGDFDRRCRERGFRVDEQTVVIVDLDKTALGARGRNDHVIDQARVEAVRRTVGDLLGGDFDPQSFQSAYDRLNQAEFHPFTADNQDYLAYLCLILGCGLYTLESLVDQIHDGRMGSFQQFIAGVDARVAELSPELRDIHSGVYALVQQGDPTPFKPFRYNEYRTTIGRMGCLGEETPVEELLRREIVITQEVREAALTWREQGVLLFGLSDKPDEASIPSDELANEGYKAIHRTETYAVGAG
jgi:hypothetical protein